MKVEKPLQSIAIEPPRTLRVAEDKYIEGYFNGLNRLLCRYKEPGSTKTAAWFEEEVYEIVRNLVLNSDNEEKEFTLFEAVPGEQDRVFLH